MLNIKSLVAHLKIITKTDKKNDLEAVRGRRQCPVGGNHAPRRCPPRSSLLPWRPQRDRPNQISSNTWR